MSEKKVGVLFVFLFMIVLFVGVGSAITCDVKLRTNCNAPNIIVMGLSDWTNAHGENSSYTNYNYVLCCDGGGNTVCIGNNKILGLSSSTNAHAEIPSLSTYSTNICYDNLECTKEIGAGCSGGYPIPTVSLSADTNAHLGNFSAYNLKICCKESITPQAYWAEDTAGFINISSLSVNPDTTSVYMVAKNTGLADGTLVSYTVKEKNTLFDDTITTKTAVSNGGTAIASWKIFTTDLDKTKDDYDYFYFTTDIAGFPNSNGLSMTIVTCPPEPPSCSGYKDSGICIDDSCSVANSDGNKRGIDCTKPGIDCKCIWEDSTCKFFWNGTIPKYCGSNITGPGEECDGNPPGKYDWGKITGCSDFDLFIGGSLKCGSDCKFDTTSCTGGISGICGDNVVNTGETCDGFNWGSITGCQNFDNFTAGDLSCGVDCHFDTNKCKKNINDPESWGSCEGMDEGSCEYTDDTSDNCDDGFLSYSWIADWTWNQDNNFGGSIPSWGISTDFFNDSGILRCSTTYSDCQGGSTTYECPSRIKLPFFSFLNLVVAALVIILIYVIINSKKKNFVKKFFKKK